MTQPLSAFAVVQPGSYALLRDKATADNYAVKVRGQVVTLRESRTVVEADSAYIQFKALSHLSEREAFIQAYLKD